MNSPLLAVAVGIATLLVLILRFRVHAFPALLVVSVAVGIVAGLAPDEAIVSVIEGMGGALGFIAIVVGLGAMLGGLLQASGGVEAIAHEMIARFGEKRITSALGVVGLIVAIPVFLDVAFIILAPVIHGLSRRTGRTALMFGLPLLAGMAAAHAFIPPTPGPIAVAELLGADLGWVILFGLLAGAPAMIVGGPLFLRIGARLQLFKTQGPPPKLLDDMAPADSAVPVIAFGPAITVVVLPLVLILLGTTSDIMLEAGTLHDVIATIGHPFIALLITCAVGFAVFRRYGDVSSQVLSDAMGRALAPAGVIILVTGAGGAFKQVLTDTGIGQVLAESVMELGLTVYVAAFVLAALVRVAQGSATVAMITAGGLMAPITQVAQLDAPELALTTIAVAAGSTVVSHVNDSAFWLVSRYLGLTEAQTLRSWTISSTLVGVVGFVVICIIGSFI